eukprot:8518083-Pyramimonas_sp.AAC.1
MADNYACSAIPTWHGDPSKWRDYKQEVKLWKLSENLAAAHSLASQLAMKLSGTARGAALNMTEAQPHPAAAADIEDPDDRKRNRNQ